MIITDKFYIDGAWVAPLAGGMLPVINPATEEAFAEIAVGGVADVDRAVAAARAAFPAFSQTSKADRIALLQRIIDAFKLHHEEMAEAISREMGSPLDFSRNAQAASGINQLQQMIKTLQAYEFEMQQGDTRIVHEAIGVCGLITPWNWPVNQIVCKVAPALAAGCTMVLKPSEISPLSGLLFAQILHEAGVPKGVFNLVNGDGPTVGAAISAHPDIDMISFTGSTRAGVSIAKAAADTVKRVAQELGGKSANIVLEDADLDEAIKRGVLRCFGNSGQSCSAPTRMYVPEKLLDSVLPIAKAAAEGMKVGDPAAAGTVLGPVVSKAQFDKVQNLIEAGIAEGAQLVTGGPGRPDGLNRGYYVRPTVFAQVTQDMRIAREEIFGPVLSILTYKDEAEAVRLANDSPYGLNAYVQSGSIENARRVARQMRAGQVFINAAAPDRAAPFGGYKQSGNGREWGNWGLEEFLEVKALMGHGAA